MDEWWKALLSLGIGFVLGFVTHLLFGRRLSDGTGDRAVEFGEQLDKVVDDISGAEDRAKESTELAVGIEDTSDNIGESVGRIRESNAGLEGAIGEAEESVGRLRKLIEEERKRREQTEGVE